MPFESCSAREKKFNCVILNIKIQVVSMNLKGGEIVRSQVSSENHQIDNN